MQTDATHHKGQRRALQVFVLPAIERTDNRVQLGGESVFYQRNPNPATKCNSTCRQGLPRILRFSCYLLASQNVIPDAGAAKVDVEVRVRASLAHETVVLHLIVEEVQPTACRTGVITVGHGIVESTLSKCFKRGDFGDGCGRE